MKTTDESSDRTRTEYERAWSEFETMEFDQQAAFWIEATAAVLGRGVQKAGQRLAQEVDDLFDGSGSAHSERSRPGPAEPGTAQQRPPRGADSSAHQ